MEAPVRSRQEAVPLALVQVVEMVALLLTKTQEQVLPLSQGMIPLAKTSLIPRYFQRHAIPHPPPV